ncbi:hypothetical protein NMG60_11032055 [Bertholletia excelsa]
MDPELYKAAKEGNNNTLLHVASQFGQAQCVMEILNLCPSMLRRVNSHPDTCLHVAARGGHCSIIQALIGYANSLNEELEAGMGTAKEMMRMANAKKVTAMHEAVRNHHVTAVQVLARGDSALPNEAGETPLYLAAERGYVGLVFVILETCTAAGYGGARGGSAVHVAAISQSRRWVAALSLCPRFSHLSIVKHLIKVDKSAAHLTDKDDKKTALHIAATHGHLCIMEELVSQCPDCRMMLEGKGQKILHIAVKNKRNKAIKFILKRFLLRNLINQKDDEGNTLLHLLVVSGCYELELIRHPKVDKMAFNNHNSTFLEVVYGEKKMDLCETRENRGYCVGAEERKDETRKMKKTKLETRIGEEEATQFAKLTARDMRRRADASLIVVALIATITFAAAFAMPDGHSCAEVLARKPAFKAFFITDALALFLSAKAVIIYLVGRDSLDWFGLQKYYTLGCILIVIVMEVMVVAFMTGLCALLAHSPGLAITLCVMGC